MQEIRLRPIGFVRNQVKGPKHEGWEEVVSELEIEDSLAPALEGIEGFSHLFVLYYMSRLEEADRLRLKIHPRDRQDLPLLGVLATRTQYRPNPIGLTLVRLLGREGTGLRVQGLDALDGTPILDLKPYGTDLDLAPEATMPGWVHRLRGNRG